MAAKSGKARRVLSTAKHGKFSAKRASRDVWELAQELTKDLTPDDWKHIPRDSSINLDHYLYGVPKVKE